MYRREIRLEELKNWLLDNGYAEDKPGYGHVDAETLANALINDFTIVTESYTL